MKKIMLMLLVVGAGLTAQAQMPFSMQVYKTKDTIYTDTLDFLSDKNLLDDTLRFNRKYRYVLKNINRFVYKESTVEQKGENFNTERPEIFKGITLPGFATINKSQPEQAPLLITEQAIRETKNKIDGCKCLNVEELVATIPSLNEAVSHLSNQANYFNEAVKAFSVFADLNNEFEKLKSDVQSTWENINTAKEDLVREKLNISPGEKDYNKRITGAFKEIQRNAKTIAEKIEKHSTTATDALSNIVTKLKECAALKRDSLCTKDTCNPQFIIRRREYFIFLNCIAKIENYISGINANYDEAVESLKEMEKAFSDGKIDVVQNNYNLLVAENFQLELEPFKADKDIHEITFTAAGAEAPLVFGKPGKRTIKVNVITCGGWKIDYSAGAFFNFGSNKFLGPDYYYEHPTDSTKIIREAGRSKGGMFSIGALMHLSPRINSVLRPAFSVGVSTTSGFDAFNFHGGVSVIFGKPGKANRIILSGGITLREVDLLNSRYALNSERKDYPDAIPVSKNFPVTGGFIAITYNLKGINN